MLPAELVRTHSNASECKILTADFPYRVCVNQMVKCLFVQCFPKDNRKWPVLLWRRSWCISNCSNRFGAQMWVSPGPSKCRLVFPPLFAPEDGSYSEGLSTFQKPRDWSVFSSPVSLRYFAVFALFLMPVEVLKWDTSLFINPLPVVTWSQCLWTASVNSPVWSSCGWVFPLWKSWCECTSSLGNVLTKTPAGHSVTQNLCGNRFPEEKQKHTKR